MKKKFLSLLLTLVMLLGLIVPASAEAGTGGDIAAPMTGPVSEDTVLPEQEVVPVDETLPVDEGAPVDETTPVDENAPVDETTPENEGAPVDETTPENEGAPVEGEEDALTGDTALTAAALGELYAELNESEGTDYTAPETAAQSDVLLFMLRYAGLADSQISTADAGSAQFLYDIEQLYMSMGVLPSGYDAGGECTADMLDTLFKTTKPLYDALHTEKLEPLFMNGMAQPIFPYTEAYYDTGETFDYEYTEWVRGDDGWTQETKTATEPLLAGTSNDDSDIIRFCVWVETNYDTDGDGKLDLVKVLVQLPKAAFEGDYKAATIYEARPYITGCTDWNDEYIEGGYDLESMYSQPAERVAAGKTTTAEFAPTADPGEWMYWNPQETIWDYEDLTWYDYYLVRGFAVVECGGLGTKGSDGFETCGTDLEIDAFKCVIEWLHGDRVAYTNKTDNIAIEADWSSGNVGMTGRSYAGTTQFGLSTTGVAGLKTIVPVAGIASWYEYTNSQGVALSISYSDYLATYCAGRYLDEADYATIAEKYGKYLQQISDDEYALNGDYGKHWATRDYTVNPLLPDWTGIKIPALIVHGLNDTNVKTKEFDLMYKAFKDAKQNVKLLLHQGTHLTPTYPSQAYELKIDGEYYDSILNKWFSHYLCGVENGIESMAAVTVQSNVDGSWDTYSKWETAYNALLQASTAADGKTSEVLGGTRHRNEEDNAWVVDTANTSATYTYEIPEDFTIQGPIAVHIRAAAKATGDKALSELDGIRLTVGINDKSEDKFNAFVPERSYLPITSTENSNAWMGGGVENFALVEYTQTPTSSKSIGLGYIDVFNPTAGYDSASAAKRTELVEGKYYNYTVYIQPTVYTVKEGHTLELTITLANYCGLDLTIDNAKTYIDMPVQSKVSFSQKAPSSSSGSSSGGTTTPVTPVQPVTPTTPTTPTTTVGGFADVSADAWYADAVKYVQEKGLMAGTGESSFEPEATVNRAMVVTVLYRLAGSPAATGTNSFTDLTQDWYKAAVQWAVDTGVTNGTGADTFDPDAEITREQLAAMIFRYAAACGYDVSGRAVLDAFADSAGVSSYALDAMQWANGVGLINGLDATTLAPSGDSNRAMLAAILMRFCENIAK